MDARRERAPPGSTGRHLRQPHATGAVVLTPRRHAAEQEGEGGHRAAGEPRHGGDDRRLAQAHVALRTEVVEGAEAEPAGNAGPKLCPIVARLLELSTSIATARGEVFVTSKGAAAAGPPSASITATSPGPTERPTIRAPSRVRFEHRRRAPVKVR